MADPTRWVDGMLHAVRDEIFHRRTSGRDERLPLVDGRFVLQGPDEIQYEFRVPSGARAVGILGGTLHLDGLPRPVPVRIGRSPAPEMITVWVERHLAPDLSVAELRYVSDGGLPALETRLQDYRIALEDRIVGLYRSASHTDEPRQGTHRAFLGLTPMQAGAAAAALAAPTSRIWGPPGTGKTRTAAALASTGIREGRKVILAGPTHRSVDLLLHAVLKDLGWDRESVTGRILRLGAIADRELRDSWGEIVQVDRLHARMRIQALEDLEGAKADTDSIRSTIRNLTPGPVPPDLQERLRDAGARVQRFEQQACGRAMDLLPGAQVVATTVHRVALGQVPRADVMVIDEASMVSTVIGVLASLHAPRLTLVGDPRQLGPIVQARTPRARQWLGTSIFDDPKKPSSGLPMLHGPCSFLSDQHRMPPSVCRVVSQLSYDGQLRSAGENGSEGQGREPSVLYLDTSRALAAAVEGHGGTRLENSPQADLVMDQVAEILGARSGLNSEVAVLTPYRSHVGALATAAGRRDLGSRVQIGTVHRVQGQEFAHVVLSLPEMRSERLGYFMRATDVSDEGWRLLTVALSRASETLLVVGDLPWLSRAAPPGGALRRFLELLRVHGHPLEDMGPVGGRCPAWEAETRSEAPPGNGRETGDAAA